ncbi:GMC oxidoreductase [Peniophora sp. CONT]|nr:GMC oxidoreductase [Peniophora sp. CONT]
MWPFSQPVFPELSPKDVGTPLAPGLDTSSDVKTYDYIIVGGGTAGSVLASRLSEDTGVKVLLLDRGSVDDTWQAKVPMMSANTFREGGPARRWFAQPLAEANDRCLEVLYGEGIGGTSRINGMVYTRGTPGDYERWVQQGNPGWGYKDLEPLFVKSETTLSQPTSNFRGRKGPWINQTHANIPFKPVQLLERAVHNIGIQSVPDVNSPTAPAAGYATLDICVDQHAYRSSTFRAFLPPELAYARRDHLKVCTNTVVTRLEVQKINGTLRATGVHFEAVDPRFADAKLFARATREVILCAGAIGSPQILMLSGIGPQNHLTEKGIATVHDLPAVGSNLQDHLGLPVMWEIPMRDSLERMVASPSVAIKELLKYLVAGHGLFALSFLQTSLFVPSKLLNDRSEVVANSDPVLDASLPENVPDIEIMPVAYNCNDVDIPGKGAFSLMIALLQPKSTGSVRLANRNPRARPDVELGYLTNPADYEVLRKAIKLALRLGEEMRRLGYPLKKLSVPASESDTDLDAFVRECLRTSYHYTSTCRMGPANGSRAAVVDAELRVHGVVGLRVADCSVFPDILATHTMAPAVLVGEKCADLIKSTRII